MNTEFIDALAADLPADERMILCGFGGDPAKVGPTAWKPRPWAPGQDLDLGAKWNAYVTVASFKRAADGTFRRRGETFAAGRALMIDDVGTKVDPVLVEEFRPSARIETSPGNEQWWYLLDKPETDGPRFDGVIRAFITGKLLGADPGMAGVTRVGRLPGFYNMKKQYWDWQVQLRELNNNRFSIEQLLDGFGLQIIGRREHRKKLVTEEALVRNAMFTPVYKFLEQRRMLKKPEPDLSGWTEITCPFIDGHTGGADTGAAIREPSPENDYYGAFRCHHGHCIDKGWQDLTDWVAEESIETLNNAARTA